MNKKKLIGVCAAALIIGSTGTNAVAANGTPDIKNNDSTTFTVRLSSNITTGYSWTCAVEPKDIVKLTGSDYITSAPAGIVGAGGFSLFNFEAVAPGKANLKFQYARPWEKNIPPVQIRSYSVTVNKDLIAHVELDKTTTPTAEAKADKDS